MKNSDFFSFEKMISIIIDILYLSESNGLNLLYFLHLLDPLMNVVESIFASMFFEVTEGEVSVLWIPSALSKRKLALEGRSADFHTGHSEFITPTAGGRPSEQFAGWIAGINDGFSRFFLEFTVRSVVDDFKVGRFACSTAANSGAAFESLGVSCVEPIAVSTTLTTGSSLIAKGGEIVDVIGWDVGAGCRFDLKGPSWDQKKTD